MDRLWASEEIYASVYRGGTRWPQAGRFIDRVLLKHGAVQLFTLYDPARYAAYFNRLASTRDEMWTGNPEAVGAEYHELYHGGRRRENGPMTYGDLFATTGGMKRRDDVMSYTIAEQGQDLDLFTDQVMARLDFLQRRLPAELADPTFHDAAGNWAAPGVVMVGDLPRQKARNVAWPFYDYGNSSLYLANILRRARVTEPELAWVNANTSGGTAFIERNMGLLNQAHVICLGQAARFAVSRCATEKMSLVYHPAYAKRFLNRPGQREVYDNTLGALVSGR